MAAMRASLQVLVVVAIGALAAALTYAASQYLLFLSQVLRLAGAEERWVGGPTVAALSDPTAELGSGSIAMLALLFMAVQSACCVAAGVASRRTRDPRPEVTAGQASLGIPAIPSGALGWGAIVISSISSCAFVLIVLRAIERSVDLVHAAGSAADERASLMAEGFSGITNIPLLGMISAVPLLGLHGFAICLASNALLRSAGARNAARLASHDERSARAWQRVPAPSLPAMLASAAALAVAGILPALAGSALHFQLLVTGFGRLAELEPAAKVPEFAAAIDEADRLLALATEISLAGTLFAVVLGAYLLIVSPMRQRRALGCERSALMPAPALGTALVASAALLASGALVRAAAPYRAENAHPIRMVAFPEYAFPPESPVPPLTGPDALEIAPILALTPGHAVLDGREVQPAGLGEDLQTLRRNWGILRPDEPFAGALNLMCGVGTQLAQGLPFLRAAHAGGYVQLRVALGRWHVVQRPVMGKLMLPRFSAAAAELATASDAISAETDVIALDAQTTCDGFARELATLRNAGRRVRVQLP